MDRRKFLKMMGIAGAGAAMTGLPWRFDPRRGLQWAQAQAFMVSPSLPLFSTTLRGLTGPLGIPVAWPDATPAPVTGVTHYTIGIQEFTDIIGGVGAPSTLFWGYRPTRALNPANPGSPILNPTARHLGGVIVAQKNIPIQITFQNTLPTSHIIPIDTSIPGANQAVNRTAVHIHGGHVPWYSDGGPFDWWAPDGSHGHSFLNNQILRVPNTAAPNEAEYYYPMDQSARLVWYHDHAWGITRINAYAGVASALVIRDAFEQNLITTFHLPQYIETSLLGGQPIVELPIVIQDKVFVNAASIPTLDPTWPMVTPTRVQGTGSLWYAHIYDPKLYKLSGNKKAGLAQNPSVVPEFFGDTMLANGTVYPSIPVEPRRYRFRILNACNARFLNLQLFQANSTAPNTNGITLNAKTLLPTNLPYTVATSNKSSLPVGSSNCWVIGNEGGFLTAPIQVPLNVPFNPVTLGGSLIMGPAERLDVVIDFSGKQGQSFILYNDAPAPFPVGAPVNDFQPNLLNPGFGPNTREIMRFDVGTTPATGSADTTTMALPANFTAVPPVSGDAWNDPLLTGPYDPVTGFPNETPITGAFVRKLTLNEAFDAQGRLIQLLGTNVAVAKGVYGRAYTDTPTETPVNGATEIWEIANLTGDTHPIHFHLVNVQVLSRQAFAVNRYNGNHTKLGPLRPPDPDERGWKETVKMHPGDVTRVVMRFILPGIPNGVTAVAGLPPAVPNGNNNLLSPRTGGNEYVWHCHILEHEEHDMMRPLVVT